MGAVFTGAKAVVTINNEIIAFASSVNVNQENTLSDVDVLGQLEVAEFAETGHKVNFTVNYFKVVNPELAQRAVDIGIESAVLSDMRDQDEFDVTIKDNNDNEIYKLSGCKFAGGSGQVDARGLWQGTWSFNAKTGLGL